MKETNKLIAKFMGFRAKMVKPNVYKYADPPFILIEKDTPEEVLDSFAEYAKYHESWDWLIPVIEKIQGMEGATEFKFMNSLEIGVAPITEFYAEVVEFIKWHTNTQN